MLIGKSIYLRMFVPEDYEQTYLWHSDPDIQETICGPRRFISKEIEKQWALKKSTDDSTSIYLAICDIKTDQMIGWYSINNIDYKNRKCHLGGVVIGDKAYRDGSAHREAGKLATDFVFNQLNMHKATGSCLFTHVMSRAAMEVGSWHFDGIERDAFFKDGKYHTICHYSLLEDEYRALHYGDDELSYAKKIVVIAKRLKKEIKDSQI